MLAGRLSYLDGARMMLRLRAEAGLGADGDFVVFVTIESETDHLPIGEQRAYWAEDALRAKQAEIESCESWAKEVARSSVERLAKRF